MLTEYVRDHAFTIAWFGLMAFVWFGWAQEDPPHSWRWKLAVGAGVGVIIAGLFGYEAAQRWDTATALDGHYVLFGSIVLVEVLVAALGCLLLWLRQHSRWMAWWVAFVVALHLLPLAWLLQDWSLLPLAVIQILLLFWLAYRLRAATTSTSQLVGPVMAGTFLLFAAVSIVIFVIA